MLCCCGVYSSIPTVATVDLYSRASAGRSPFLATPGVCEATHILPVAKDGDLDLSHFHWKTTASGYHRCQQGARGVALAMMLLAAAAAEVGETCFGYIFCLALWPACYKTPCCRASALPAKANYSVFMWTHLDSGSCHHPDDRCQNWGWDDRCWIDV